MSLSEERQIVDALIKINRLSNELDEPRPAMKIIIDEIMNILPAASASIDLINPDTKLLEIEVFRGLPAHAQEFELHIGKGITGWVALHGKPLLVPDVSKEPRYICVRESIKSELAVPMIISERGQDITIGVINIDSEEINAFSEEDQKVLEILTNEATRVMNRIWLLKQLQNKADKLQSLVNIGSSLVSKLELKDILNTVSLEAKSIMSCKMCAILMLDEDGETLSLAAMSETEQYPDYKERILVDESSVGTAILRKRQVEVIDLRKTEEHHFVEISQKEGLVSLLSSPLISDNTVVGVLNAYTDRPHRFSNDEKNAFQALANFAALAIQNSQLYSKVFESEEILRRNDRLHTLGLLSAEIAHEIRNPLTVIKLLFDGLNLKFDKSDMRSKDIEIIDEKLQQLESIVSRVLSFGKSRAAMFSHFSTQELVSDTLHLVRLKLTQNGIKVHTDFPNTPLMVECNKGQIQQALLNLILNAIDVMPDGGELYVDIQTEDKDNLPAVVMNIKDTGEGIEELVTGKVFDSFFSQSPSGTGLGLGIVKRIMESHRGDVFVAESTKEGTKMSLWLPLVP